MVKSTLAVDPPARLPSLDPRRTEGTVAAVRRRARMPDPRRGPRWSPQAARRPSRTRQPSLSTGAPSPGALRDTLACSSKVLKHRWWPSSGSSRSPVWCRTPLRACAPWWHGRQQTAKAARSSCGTRQASEATGQPSGWCRSSLRGSSTGPRLPTDSSQTSSGSGTCPVESHGAPDAPRARRRLRCRTRVQRSLAVRYEPMVSDVRCSCREDGGRALARSP